MYFIITDQILWLLTTYDPDLSKIENMNFFFRYKRENSAGRLYGALSTNDVKTYIKIRVTGFQVRNFFKNSKASHRTFLVPAKH